MAMSWRLPGSHRNAHCGSGDRGRGALRRYPGRKRRRQPRWAVESRLSSLVFNTCALSACTHAIGPVTSRGEEGSVWRDGWHTDEGQTRSWRAGNFPSAKIAACARRAYMEEHGMKYEVDAVDDAQSEADAMPHHDDEVVCEGQVADAVAEPPR